MITGIRDEIDARTRARLSSPPDTGGEETTVVIGQFILVGEEVCPNCINIKEVYAEEFENDEMRYVDIDSFEGKAIEEKFGISEVPFIVFRRFDTGEYIQCGFRYDDDGNIEIFQEDAGNINGNS